MSHQNTFYSKENHGNYELISLGEFHLAEGGVIPNLELAVKTQGTLNQDKSNAILITTWYSGTTKIWEDAYLGENRALDPSKYFIILVNQIGNGLSTSANNSESPIDKANFPKVRIEDDVIAQHKLLTEHFEIEQLELVVGGSMGAQQTYEWIVRFPDFMRKAAPIAGYAKNSEHDFIFTKTLNDTFLFDPNFNNGDYEHTSMIPALKRQANLWDVMGYSTEMFRQKAYQSIGFETALDFSEGFTEQYFSALDPNVLLTCAWKWQRGDVSRNTGGDLKAALGRVKAKVFVMPIDTDMFFIESECKLEQEQIPNSEFRPIKSIWGHLALFGMDKDYLNQVDEHLKELLNS